MHETWLMGNKVSLHISIVYNHTRLIVHIPSWQICRAAIFSAYIIALATFIFPVWLIDSIRHLFAFRSFHSWREECAATSSCVDVHFNWRVPSTDSMLRAVGRPAHPAQPNEKAPNIALSSYLTFWVLLCSRLLSNEFIFLFNCKLAHFFPRCAISVYIYSDRVIEGELMTLSIRHIHGKVA